MNVEFENQIKSKIPLIKNKVNILHFSTGADSVACFLRLREFGIEPILIYDYFLPHIPMVDNYIDYFEKKFNIHIYRLPSTLYTQTMDNALYQLPVKAREQFRNNITHYELWKVNKNKVRKQILKSLNVKQEQVIFHKGIRYTDGQMRYMSLKKFGVLTKQNVFFPVASFTVNDIKDILKKYDCKLPVEYGLWGISLEAPRSFNAQLIKDNCPKSWEYILKYFPLMNTLRFRPKYNFLNKHFKIRLAQFKGFAIDKSLYEEW